MSGDASAEVGAGRLWAPLILGAILAVGGLEWVRANAAFDPETAGVGAYSKTVFGSVDGRPVHCRDLRDSARCEAAYRAAGSPAAVLWLGNSQLHAVNRHRPGQRTASQQLHQALAAEGRYLVTYSQPNATLEEHRALLAQLLKTYDVRTLVLAVCLDDFRQTGSRPSVTVAPEASPSLQSSVEGKLTQALGQQWPLWAERTRLRALSDYLAYLGRNLLLGIDARTKRPVAPDQYRRKMALLGQITAEARAGGIDVLLYAPPYRRDIEGPYVEGQYAAFRRDLRELADGEGVRVADLTDAVPGPEWGRLRRPLGRDDYDFMHFTAEGHRRLAGELARAL